MLLVVSVFLSLSTCLTAPGYQALAIGWREHQQVGSCGQQGEETEAAAALKARGYAQPLCSGVGESRPGAVSEGHSGVLHGNVSTRRHCKKTPVMFGIWIMNTKQERSLQQRALRSGLGLSACLLGRLSLFIFNAVLRPGR